jgi:hypothetical protein
MTTWLCVWLAGCFPSALFVAAFMRAGKGPALIKIEEQSTCVHRGVEHHPLTLSRTE